MRMIDSFGDSLQRLAINERPQERLERKGANALSDSELLAIILRKGCQGFDVLSLANEIIADAGSLSGLLNWSTEDFCQKKGIGKIKALQLITILEVTKRIVQQQQETPKTFETAEDIFQYAQTHTTGLEVEKFWVLCLNARNSLIKCVEVTSGIANASLVHPREVYREAIRYNATAVAVFHNHPSGDPTPSRQDIYATRQLKEASQTVCIELLDHVIVGQPTSDPHRDGFYSFHERGLI